MQASRQGRDQRTPPRGERASGEVSDLRPARSSSKTDCLSLAGSPAPRGMTAVTTSQTLRLASIRDGSATPAVVRQADGTRPLRLATDQFGRLAIEVRSCWSPTTRLRLGGLNPTRDAGGSEAPRASRIALLNSHTAVQRRSSGPSSRGPASRKDLNWRRTLIAARQRAGIRRAYLR